MTVDRIRSLLTMTLLLICEIASAVEHRHITIFTPPFADGIQWSRSNSLYVDEHGTVWVGTESGISCINSNGATTFLLGSDYPKGFSTTDITRICGDGGERLFVCGSNNVGEIDLKTMVFHEIAAHGSQTLCFKGNCLFFDNKNSIYTYFVDSGETKKVVTLPEESEITSLSKRGNDLLIGTSKGSVFFLHENGDIDYNISGGSRINEIYIDSKDNIWIGCISTGITLISSDGSTKVFRHESKNTFGLDSDFVRCFCEDNSGNVWIGTFEGLSLYDDAHDHFYHHRLDLQDIDYISNASICSMVKDEQGTIWVGTFFGGLHYFNPKLDLFTEFRQGEKPETGLSSSVVGSMSEDNDGNIWIATRGGGLNLLNRNTGTFEWFSYKKGKHSTQDNISTVVFDFENNVFWIGTNLSGLCKFDLNTKSLSSCKTNSNNISAILPYGSKIILGTKKGLYLYDPSRESCTEFLMGEKTDVQPSDISSLLQDKSGNIWIGTNNAGIFVYSPTSNVLVQHVSETNLNGFHSFKATDILQSSDGRIWIGTPDCGIEVTSDTDGHFTVLNHTDSHLASNSIVGLAESPITGKIYINTTNGLSIFDPDSKKSINLNQSNGAPISLTRQRPLITKDGTVFIGSVNGLVSFKEENLNFTPVTYRSFLTNLFVNGKEILPGDESGILEKTIQYTEKIIIKPSMSTISVDFASTNFLAFNSSGFEYRMNGLTMEWLEANPKSRITYSNLPAGNYTLQIRPRGDFKNYCNSIELNIKVLPHWYKTKLAFILYILAALFCLYLAVSIINSKRRAKDAEALSQEKMQFFTSISHEIKTPVTIIISEIESMMKSGNFTPSLYKKLLTIYKNGFSLNNLVNELLEFRKQEQGKTVLNVSPNNIVSFAFEASLLFSDYAQLHNIKLNFSADVEKLEVWYDQSLMNKVLNNILSNALKFTEAGGEINIHVFSETSYAIIEVSDTGIGIPEKELENIFLQFYQVGKSSSAKNEKAGTGIGLALAKSIIRLHSGDITVSSEIGKGSTFKISLPLGYAHFSKDILISDPGLNIISEEFHEIKQNNQNDIEANGERHKIVIAEDNDDIRNLLTELFAPHYDVFQAKDGEQALSIIQEEMPSIVLSDVMMPKMTGTELCRKLKKDVSICHIPIVLLTAISSVEQNLLGLKNGADDYIVKPFNSELLLSRCNNLVNSRILLKTKFSAELSSNTISLATNAMDKEFINKASEIIYANLDNCDFDMLTFAKELALSKSGLFKKIRSISGQTPNDFVQTIRLKESAKLLISKPEMNINEISEHTGFGSAQYFSKCFKKKYGQSPLTYRNKLKNNII